MTAPVVARRPFPEISASEVAAVFRALGRDKTSSMKLCYYAQGLHLAFFDSVLFTEQLERWEYGPVPGYDVWSDWNRVTCDGRGMDSSLLLFLFCIGRWYSMRASVLRDLSHSQMPWNSVPPREPIPIAALRQEFRAQALTAERKAGFINLFKRLADACKTGDLLSQPRTFTVAPNGSSRTIQYSAHSWKLLRELVAKTLDLRLEGLEFYAGAGTGICFSAHHPTLFRLAFDSPYPVLVAVEQGQVYMPYKSGSSPPAPPPEASHSELTPLLLRPDLN
jgi:hypothetical protein